MSDQFKFQAPEEGRMLVVKRGKPGDPVEVVGTCVGLKPLPHPGSFFEIEPGLVPPSSDQDTTRPPTRKIFQAGHIGVGYPDGTRGTFIVVYVGGKNDPDPIFLPDFKPAPSLA